MGWEDRPYYRDQRRPGGATGNPLMWLWNGSLPLGTWFGIRVRMHSTMVIFIGLNLLFSSASDGLGPTNALTSMTILFFSVLLHEFGHCFGARFMGGEAHDILMWPIGGLAFTSPPRRPWPSLVTTAAGPMVNLIICIVSATAIAVINGSIRAVPWLPVAGYLRSYVSPSWAWTTYYLWWIFLVNWALLTFNMLMVFYPFDGGRIVQELLWFKFGYYRSMQFATVFGMVGAVAVAMVALVWWSFTLLFIAGFGFYTCYKQRQILRYAGPEMAEDPVDYSAAYENPNRRNRTNDRAAKLATKKLAMEREEQAKIDKILEKVSEHGMQSLNWLEKRTLQRATERQRRADAERVRRATR